MRPITVLLVSVLAMPALAEASILPVPGAYPTIQSAIAAADSGDTVLVEPGTYMENINFIGKEITVAGRFLISNDPADITATVLNGSTPSHPDTASCVLIVSGEGPGAVLTGFTITGGDGTKWLDEHGAGLYREGGGILVTRSSPVIRNNYIIQNAAVNAAGTVSAGGGGIRVGDGDPLIEGNVIMLNRGLYGGGVVLNYCSGAILRNNIITQNTVDQDFPGKLTFGGGGVWILERKPGDGRANILENNSIVGNLAFGNEATATAGRGGGLVVTSASVLVRNTVVWNNHQSRGGQINGSPDVSYSCIQGGFSGTGNIDSFPLFADSAFLLAESSPCIDAGDPDPSYDDPGTPTGALFPSRGTRRNDIGAYGGPGRPLPSPLSKPGLYAGVLQAEGLDLGLWLPGESVSADVPITNLGSAPLTIEQAEIVDGAEGTLSVVSALPLTVSPGATSALELRWSPTAPLQLEDTLLLFHDGVGGITPLSIPLRGSSIPVASIALTTATIFLGNIEASAAVRETTFFIANTGTAPDSVYLSIDPRGVTPAAALAVLPEAVVVPARDSVEVTFSVNPSQIVVTGLGIYSPKIIIESRFSPGSPRFERSVNFRIVGTAGVGDLDAPDPSRFRLGQNYPNPFNPTTTIEFTLGVAAEVDLTVFDPLGREVAHLLRADLGPGTFQVRWDASGSPSGQYFYRLKAGAQTEVRKLVLIR